MARTKTAPKVRRATHSHTGGTSEVIENERPSQTGRTNQARAHFQSSEKSPQPRQRRRVQLDFLPDAHDRLNELKKLSKTSSTPELVRTALRLLEWYLIRTKQDGYSLQLVKDRKIIGVDLGL
jgi:hypothetical protein